MNIEAKPRTIVAVVLIVLILVGGYFYWNKTAPVRRYKAEIKQLRMISEHQRLDIETYEQRTRLAAIKKELEKNRPTYKLTPEDPNE